MATTIDSKVAGSRPRRFRTVGRVVHIGALLGLTTQHAAFEQANRRGSKTHDASLWVISGDGTTRSSTSAAARADSTVIGTDIIRFSELAPALNRFTSFAGTVGFGGQLVSSGFLGLADFAATAISLDKPLLITSSINVTPLSTSYPIFSGTGAELSTNLNDIVVTVTSWKGENQLGGVRYHWVAVVEVGFEVNIIGG